MAFPNATYRLQFRDCMDFDTAAGIVPYLKELGVSHLYASPIFTATTGSTHGYDVTNHNEIDPALGGRGGFDRLSARLKEARLGLVLDIVPNHMAASTENPWWRSIIEWGKDSLYARHFDVDWTRRLTLPILGKPIEQSLADGDIALVADREHGNLALACPGHMLPLHPSTYAMTVGNARGNIATQLLNAVVDAKPEREDALHDRLRSILNDDAASVDKWLAQLSRDPHFLEHLHDAQPWQLMFWQRARSELSYRRFFEITGLAGLRVEDEQVFDDAHRLALELVHSGQVDGLRIDHVDGLADPKGYLERLRQKAGPDTYIVVEKILERGEDLPADWPVEGTTGYEFVDMSAGLFTDPAGCDALDRAYAEVTGQPSDIAAMAREAKLRMVTHNFEAELSVLVRIATEAGLASSEQDLRTAIVELVTAFPVYRTYGRADGIDAYGAELLDEVAETAKGAATIAAVDEVVAFLKHNPEGHADQAAEFRARFQQLTSPIMAKSIEDTLFYRFNRLIALNEVGGDLNCTKDGVASFHARMCERAKTWPFAMTGSATHDTKRGEDARARLYALTEKPDEWAAAVARWRGMHSGLVRDPGDGPAPDPETEWLLYQALAGIWPDGEDAPDAGVLAGIAERFMPYLEKALREAKQRTGWLSVNEPYEAAVRTYAARLLDPGNAGFIEDFYRTLRPYAAAGVLNSLSQTLIKMTAPGVPDIYQGTELQDFSLVDPDNRRPVDFNMAFRNLRGGGTEGALGMPGLTKQKLIRTALGLRQAHPELFARGDYTELKVSGKKAAHVIAFARRLNGKTLVVAVPRLTMGLIDAVSYDPAKWGNTAIKLPKDLADIPMSDILNGGQHAASGRIELAKLLRKSPFGLIMLNAEGAGKP